MSRTITIFQGKKRGLPPLSDTEKQQLKSLFPPKNGIGSYNLRKNEVQVKDYVGMLGTQGLRLEVLPKVFDEFAPLKGHFEERKDQTNFALQCLVRWWDWTGEYPLKATGQQPVQGAQGSLFEHIIERFLSQLEPLTQYGIHQEYLERTETQQTIKGRINFGETLRRHPGRQHLHQVQVARLSSDHGLNRYLVAALRTILHHTASQGHRNRIYQLLKRFEGVPPAPLPAVTTIRFQRMNEGYRPAFELARLFLQGQVPGLSQGRYGTMAFISRTENIFEKLIEAALNSRLPRDWSLEYQYEQKLNPAEGKWGKIKPDLIIRDANNKVRAIVDPKFKVHPSSETKLIPSRNDRFQLISYAGLLNCRHIFLVYPQPWSPHKVQARNDQFKVQLMGKEVTFHVLEVPVTGEHLETVAEALAPVWEIL